MQYNKPTITVDDECTVTSQTEKVRTMTLLEIAEQAKTYQITKAEDNVRQAVAQYTKTLAEWGVRRPTNRGGLTKLLGY